MNKRPLIDTITEQLEDAKATDIIVLAVSQLTDMTDHMIIASGNSIRHINAIGERLTQHLKKQQGIVPLGIEGRKLSEWLLIDLDIVIVHIMHPDTRSYYQLEKLWKDYDYETVLK